MELKQFNKIKKTHKIIKPKEERKKTPYKIDLFKVFILFAAIAILFIVLYEPVKDLFSPENMVYLKEKINETGFLAHVAYILAVAMQVVLSFIPATGSITIFGGFVFGPILGTAYTLLGIIIGSAIAFYLGRRYGRPALEDWVQPELLKKFDEKSEQKGLFALLVIFLIPFTPDNAVCFVAGTTKMRIRNMVIVSAIGRLPSTVISTTFGAGLGSAFSPAIIITITVTALLIGLAFAHRKAIENGFKL